MLHILSTLWCLFVIIACGSGISDSISYINTQNDTLVPEAEDKNVTEVGQWSPETLPNPQVDVDKCGRKGQKSYVCDPNVLVAYEDANILDQFIASIKEESKCTCNGCPKDKDGYMFSLVIVKKEQIKLGTEIPEEEELQNFAEELRKNWNFGYCDNDVLILLVADIGSDGKKVYSSIGTKAAEVLTKTCSKKFYTRARSYFNANVYALGLDSMLKDYGKNAIKGQCDDTWDHGTTAGIVLGSLFGIIVIVSVIFMIIECIRRRYHELRRKKKFHYALSYSSAAVAQRRFPTSHSWSALKSNERNNIEPGSIPGTKLVRTGFAGLPAYNMKTSLVNSSDAKT